MNGFSRISGILFIRPNSLNSLLTLLPESLVTLWPTSWNTLLALLYHSHTRAHIREHSAGCAWASSQSSHSGSLPGTLCWLCYITVTLGPIFWNTLLAVLYHSHTRAHILEHSAGCHSHTLAHLLEHSAGCAISQSHSGPSPGTLCWLCLGIITVITLWPTSWNTLLALESSVIQFECVMKTSLFT